MHIISALKRLARDLHRHQSGATMVEYALIVSLVSFLIVGSLGVAGDSLNTIFGDATDAMNEVLD